MKHLILSSFLLSVSSGLSSQIIEVKPVFPGQDETLTIIFDAKELNSNAMLNANEVYMHSSIGDNPDQFVWTGQYTVGNWGQDDGVGQMTPIGNDRWKISLIPDVYYNLPSNVTAYNLAMVFRNEDGSVEGKNPDGSDIFFPLFGDSLANRIVKPSFEPHFANVNDTVNVYAATSDSAEMNLYLNGNLVKQSFGDSLGYEMIVMQMGINLLEVISIAVGDTVVDSLRIIVNNPLVIQDPPAGTTYGMNVINDSTVRLSLVAPGKSFVYPIGSFSKWEVNPDYQMKLSVDSNVWWTEINGLDKNEEYIYQFFIDGEIKVADPYTEKTLDPWNDQWIPQSTYPGLIDYPYEFTTGVVSTFIINESEYTWINNSFTKPDRSSLVIYELLIRDFLAAHDYQTLIDTLDYLDHLGVNAIELMPVNEFEGNESWGYNPSFYFAVDKYYGTKNMLKKFIDECHSRGIAVILDVVLNHSFSLSPMVQMYWAGNKPAADNPWYNQDARHDFNVGYDFNHESPHTVKLVDDVIRFWLNEFRVDGYRFDLSKGFTQKNTLGNISAWGAYDQSRIDIWKRIADTIWSYDPDFYVILEHFADNSEEKVLSDYGMMLWGNANYPSAEATMGYISTSDLSWGYSYKERNWSDPNLVSYAESHDEERLMYKNLTFGNSQGSYSTRHLNTGLARVEALATIFFSVPGPKMMWMFGELGYDVSIDDPCRICNKPIRWNYFDNANRIRLYEVYSAMINLRTLEAAFSTINYAIDLNGAVKKVELTHPDMDVVATANFQVELRTSTDIFPHTGKWYEFFSGDSLQVISTDHELSFLPGQYFLFTTKKLDQPDIPAGISNSYVDQEDLKIFPNPNKGQFIMALTLNNAETVEISLTDIGGKILEEENRYLSKGSNIIEFDHAHLPPGHYILSIKSHDWVQNSKITVVK